MAYVKEEEKKKQPNKQNLLEGEGVNISCHCVLDGHDLKKNLFSRDQIQSHKCPLIFIIVISTGYYTQEGHCCFVFLFLIFSISFFTA